MVHQDLPIRRVTMAVSGQDLSRFDFRHNSAISKGVIVVISRVINLVT
jgi:hypothetical protein